MFKKRFSPCKKSYAFLATVFSCISFFVLAQSAIKTSLAANQWKTFIISDIKELSIAAPPGKEQTQKELKEVREKMSRRDDKILQQIHYWNAGSPAYRWNQVGYQ